jgi:hypothetical protein
MAEKETTIESVRAFETQSGKSTRFVVKDSDGDEYTTFRERIGEAAQAFEGRRARIEFHEEQRGQYTNVYLDKIEPAPAEGGSEAETDPEEVGWRTAVEAAPYLAGSPKGEVEPDELFEKLKPFKDRVSEDIREGDAEEEDRSGG